MIYQHRILYDWPGELRAQRASGQFKADWGRTLHDLDRELAHLRAEDIVLETAHTEADLRLDGTLRGNAGYPVHPGVVLSFDSRHGPLRYWTDAFVLWRFNVRAIALGLEALRAVDRYGITSRGEQYTGWARLGAGEAPPQVERVMSETRAREVISELAGMGKGALHSADESLLSAMYRFAARRAHPDTRMDGVGEDAWGELGEAARVLGLSK